MRQEFSIILYEPGIPSYVIDYICASCGSYVVRVVEMDGG